VRRISLGMAMIGLLIVLGSTCAGTADSAGTVYYVAANEPGASDSNNGLGQFGFRQLGMVPGYVMWKRVICGPCAYMTTNPGIERIRHRFSAHPGRFTLLLALDNSPAPRNVLEAAGLLSGRSKL